MTRDLTSTNCMPGTVLRLFSITSVIIGLMSCPVVAATLPSGFTESLVADGIPNPTAMACAPDGRLFVCQQNGQLRIIKNSTLLSSPFLTVETDSFSERGLLGVTLDPGFATNNYIYIFYTVPGSPAHNRVSRFTANGDVALTNSEVVILELNDLSNSGDHNGGAIHFGADGKLYVATGDNHDSNNAQTVTNLLGKLLRIDSSGSIPADNPFYNTATGLNRAIWVLGLRNPFTFAVQPGTGRIFINDVGNATWEEINDGVAGANYGWPVCEGFCAPPNPGFRDPVYRYANNDAPECAITGGAFYNPAFLNFPTNYPGVYFFADYCAGWIRTLDPANGNTVSDFASGVPNPVDLQVGDDGSLYYLSRGFDSVFKIQYSSAPGIIAQPMDQIVKVGEPATFSVNAAGPGPLNYRWQRDGANITGAVSNSFTLVATSTNDDGAVFWCIVTNSFGSVTSNPAMLFVTTNNSPTATITSPTNGSLYSAGETINFAGLGADSEDGNLPAGAFSWTIVFHHDTHTHPFLGPLTNVTSGSFTIPTLGEKSANVFYRIHLTVVDSGGLQKTVSVDVLPRTVTIMLATAPPGLQVTLDGQPTATPTALLGVVGMSRTLGVVSPQTANGTNYEFVSWSDSGVATHTIFTPATNTAYTASFQVSTAPPVLSLCLSNNQLTLTWPAYATGFALQSTPSLTPVVTWTVVTNPVVVTNGLNTVTVDAFTGQQFYRLCGTNISNPYLDYKLSGSTLALSWPAAATNFVLQFAMSLTPTIPWANVTNSVVITNGQSRVMDTLTESNRFYRLFKP